MQSCAHHRPLVHALLIGAMMGLFAFNQLGCLVPPYQALEAPENTAPLFLLGATTPNPTQITTQQRTPAGESPKILAIASRVVDPDDQRLTLRAFGDADYERPIAITPDSVDPVSRPDGLRLFEVTISGLCDTWLQPAERTHHTLELYVTDGEFLGATGRGVSGGERDSISWVIFCEDLPQ